MIRNLALGFIKPHAGKSIQVWDCVRSMLEKQGIRVSAEMMVTGPEIRKKGLIDRHYAAIARIGACPDASALDVNDKSASAFRDMSGISWESAIAGGKLVVSGLLDYGYAL